MMIEDKLILAVLVAGLVLGVVVISGCATLDPYPEMVFGECPVDGYYRGGRDVTAVDPNVIQWDARVAPLSQLR